MYQENLDLEARKMVQNEVIHPFLYQATSYPTGTFLSGDSAPFWFTPALSLACWQELYEPVEKEGSVDYLIHQGKKERCRSVQEDAIWTAQGVSPLSGGNKLKSHVQRNFQSFLSLILFWKWILKHCIGAFHSWPLLTINTRPDG